MRKICLLIWVLLEFQYGHSATIPYTSAAPASWPSIKLANCITLSFADIERLSGRKLNLFQRMSITLFKNKMKKALRKDPDMTLDQFMRSRKTSDSVGAGLVIFAVIGLVLVIMMLVFHRSYDP
jgi:hypothetical protein